MSDQVTHTVTAAGAHRGHVTYTVTVALTMSPRRGMIER